MARRRISRRHLADDAKTSISTLEKALNGSCRLPLALVPLKGKPVMGRILPTDQAASG